ncbi:MAG: A24 family peptidase [Alphaproteobacteria bacterium]|nr:A24 family peptidase [Alphaproteobacteria bacterium]
MFLYLFWGFFILLLCLALFLSWQIAKTDMKRRIIPDAYLFPLLIIGTITVTFFPWVCSIESSVIGMAFGYVMAATVGMIFDKILLRRNPNSDTPIGMGDIKLIGVGGLWMGPMGLAIALVLACIFGAIWSYKQHQKFIPFAPFFIGGGILSLIIIRFLL